MVHILSRSVSFRKVPIRTQVLVFCGTEPQKFAHKQYIEVYGMFWYQMKINSFKGKYCMHVKTDTIMYTSLHLNQLACQLCISCRMSSFLFPNTLCRTEHLKSILVILIIKIIVNLIGLNLSLFTGSVPFRSVP